MPTKFPDGEVYGWGHNHLGQLGLGHQQGPQKEPSLITSLSGSPLVYLAAAGHHSAALTLSGFLLTWGSNKHGQLGYTPKKDPELRWVLADVFLLYSCQESKRYVQLEDEDALVGCGGPAG